MLKLRKPTQHQLKRAVVAKLTGQTSCHDCAYHYHRATEVVDKYSRFVSDVEIVPRCALNKNPAFLEVQASRGLAGNIQVLSWAGHKEPDFRMQHPAYQGRCERHSPRPAAHSAAALKWPGDVQMIALPARVARHIASHFKAETRANERRTNCPNGEVEASRT